MLLAKLKGAPIPAWPKSLPDASTPIFITWKINDELRGCIGTFSPDLHSKIVPEYAITAAMKDPRFDPMNIQEVDKNLTVNVSLLVNFEEGKDAYDWEVGKHGIIIKSTFNNGYYSGTFLPEVASEQGWDKTKTLKHLIKKAGFYGDLSDIENTIKLTRYQSSKASLSFNEYVEKS